MVGDSEAHSVDGFISHNLQHYTNISIGSCGWDGCMGGGCMGGVYGWWVCAG